MKFGTFKTIARTFLTPASRVFKGAAEKRSSREERGTKRFKKDVELESYPEITDEDYLVGTGAR